MSRMHHHARVSLLLYALILLIGVAGCGSTSERPDANLEGVEPTSVGTDQASLGVALSPGRSERARPGETVVYTHEITNTGTATDSYALTASSAGARQVMLFDRGHSPSSSLSVQLGAGERTTVSLSVTLPSGVLSGTAVDTLVTARSSISETVRATARNTTLAYRPPGVLLSPGDRKEGEPGSLITFTHRVTNTGPAQPFDIEARSQLGWPVTLLTDGSAEPTNSLSVELGELESVSLLVNVQVPDISLDSRSDQIRITVTSSISHAVRSWTTDTVRIRATVVSTRSLVRGESQHPPLAKFGVDFGYMMTDPEVLSYDLPLVKEMGADWIRVFLPWRDVEMSRGEYAWEEYDTVFDRIEETGMHAIVVIHAAPDWAAEESCGPISDTVALEEFLDRLIPRYARMTEVWEFINEPDGREPHGYGPAIGCWGLHPEDYARQLQIFHAKVKKLDAGALVFFGGLAYDGWDHFERSFFDKALESGAGPYFDGVSLHYYPINPKDFPTMAHKINEISGTMEKHHVRDKRIWVTETGMWVNRRGSVEQQRDFIVKAFSRGFSAGADGIFWFDPRARRVTGGGVQRWLISPDHEPINGYTTFEHMAHRLEGLRCTGGYEEVPPGIEAYSFRGQERSVYVLWSDSERKTVSIPAETDGLLIDRDGSQTTLIQARHGKVEFQAGTEPVFLEIRNPVADPEIQDEREEQ